MQLGAAPQPTLEPSVELADLLGHAMRRVHRGTRGALAPLGLSGSDARVVRLLAGGPLRMSLIAERLGVVPRAATDMVDRVEVAALVVRRVAPLDRRSVLVELTPAGRRLLVKLERARRASAEAEFGVLSPAQREDLAGLLRTLCERGGCPACAATGPGGAGAEFGAAEGTNPRRGRTLEKQVAKKPGNPDR
ncbi:MAG: MarR family winged helix-turn-helix transcriptional regulator [Candidatus Limnocylindrales bacterium]